ncbi:WD40-repeat-containing domain protein [Stachybotrys elegans]|uniref:WD40-repeat-containing domain protein n=1 Tax=Stachybotrys elegans TaxID=80388 RepID=A0A8K0SRL7_9HYPO|nr:WD40-repeat-containing domain protein [Stachybotrys elegans]
MEHHGPSSSSPAGPLLSPTRTSHRKEKRNPSVTPRRFGRFFTPRNAVGGPTRRILANLDAAAINRVPISPQSVVSDALDSDPICSSPIERAVAAGRKRKATGEGESVIKRRGALVEDLALPPLPLPTPISVADVKEAAESSNPADAKGVQEALGQRRKAVLNYFFNTNQGKSRASVARSLSTSCDDVAMQDVNPLETYQPKPIRKFANRGLEAQLLEREHGFAALPGKQHMSFPAADYRSETASFYSRSLDVFHCTSQNGRGNTIPFCLASARNAPITAIGDEEGCVRFLSTSMTESPSESKISLYGKVHENAIMSLAFSADDMRLATACGDRTGKILDVATETIAVNLDVKHHDSLRQIAFQPGQSEGNVLATSDRAGRIQVWDIRCAPVPINAFSSMSPTGVIRRNTQLRAVGGQTVNTIDNAHQRIMSGMTSPASVTSIHWLPAGREHLLLSASEANACVKLWDTRYIKPRRQFDETPLAMTAEPSSHSWRSYGITSLAVSSDAARFYAVCRDSTVYAFSTAHLMLGNAPELSFGAAKRRPTGAEGLGPLYGLRHDMFRAHSFYVKCALRPSAGHSSELLAVGSSLNCAMLMPLDERYMKAAWDKYAHEPNHSSSATPLATPSQSFSRPSSSAPPVPIFNVGTPLIRGHEREVAVPSWSHDGKLVTASDDYIVRHWQQGADEARRLRQVGEFGGERHMAGWADVGADWDIEDDDDEC